MCKSRLVLALAFIGMALALGLTGCAPLRDQNGHPVLDRDGNEQFHKAL